jgi:predicted solute-binding protein
MTNNLDDELHRALRAVDPGEEFTLRVTERIAQQPMRSRHSVPPAYRWLSVAVLTGIVLAALIAHDQRLRHEQQGLEARRQLIEALRVTGEKLDLAYRVVNDDAHPASGENSGA